MFEPLELFFVNKI